MLKSHTTSCWKSEEYSGKTRLLAFSPPLPEHPAQEGTIRSGSWLEHGCPCLCAGCQVERQGSTCARAANSAPHLVLYTTQESFPKGPPRVGLNTGTILAQLKAAYETPGRRPGSSPSLPCTSAEYHPLPRAWHRRLQGTVSCRRVPECSAPSSPARKGTVLIPEDAPAAVGLLTSPRWPARSGPSESTGDDEGNSLAPGGRSRRHEIGQ